MIKSAEKFASFLWILVLGTKTKRFEHTGMSSQEKKIQGLKPKKSRTYTGINITLVPIMLPYYTIKHVLSAI
jgi:hypothetical protein